MIIGIDEQGNIISIGIREDKNAHSIKVIKDQFIDINRKNYKYDRGRIIELGFKKAFELTTEEKIKEKLNELDKTINRATEDLYTLTNTTPYQSTKEVINRKIELREQLKTLKIEE